ncbi:alpha/beta hydrolase family protein [Streptomyces antibioticus]|uniref:alpha/beta hydrolase family protein n=1 Tax=Streptomyces antibioticus TaxID=1890 RepID=UPI0033E8FCC8
MEEVSFTTRWETVVRPVIDRPERRKDVDRSRIAITGLSMGGNLVARAAAFEHRLAAVACMPGCVSPWPGCSTAPRWPPNGTATSTSTGRRASCGAGCGSTTGKVRP